MAQNNIVWQPQPGSQALFLTSPYFETLYAGTRGCGKAQPLESKILTENGFIYMGEAQEGIEILNPDGSQQQIVDVFPQGIQKVYKIILENDAITHANSEHLWITANGQIVNTDFLMENQKFLQLPIFDSGNIYAKKIKNISFYKEMETQCIKVDNPNGLYITDDFIITHNTDALLMDFAQHVGQGFGIDWRGVLFRQTFAQLSDVISKTKKFFYQIFPEAKFNAADYKWTWPDGEELLLRYLNKIDDYWNYHGHAYPWIAFEELTSWGNDEIYHAMKSCCRSINPKMPRKYRATTNPYGAGHCVPYGEVLTPNGWKDIKDFKVGDPVYTVNKNRHIIETKVDQVHKHWIENKMIYVTNKFVHMNMTQNHSIPIYENSFFTLKPFNEIKSEKIKLINSAKYNNEVILDKQFIRFLFIILQKTDYFLNLYSLSKKEREIINKFDFNNVEKNNLSEIFKKQNFIDIKEINNKIDFLKCLSNLPFKYLSEFVLYIVATSGKYNKNTGHGYIQHDNKKYLDIISILLIQTGFSVYSKRNHNGYKLSFNKKQFIDIDKKSQITSYDYKGFVYCLGIEDTHTFIIRQKGKVWISGNSWVKEYFVDPAPPGTPVENNAGVKRVFIRGSIYENKILMENDPQYIKNLESIDDPNLKEAWLYGSWNLNTGGILDGVWNKNIHVIEPFDIPSSWYIKRSFDWGSARPYSLGIWAESNGEEVTLADGSKKSFPPKTMFRIAELYGFSGKANEGVYETPRQIAENILEFEKQLGVKIVPGPADSAMFDTSSFGTSIAGEMARHGVFFKKSDKRPGSRIAGLEKVRTMLKNSLDSPMEMPGLFIFNNCTQFLRTVPSLSRDQKNPNDVDTDGEDHIWDETRYAIMDNLFIASKKGQKHWK